MAKINGHDVDADEHIIQTQVANPEVFIAHQRGRHQQHGRNQTVSETQHRTGDTDVISFAGEEVCFHEQRTKVGYVHESYFPLTRFFAT